jgi:hypothetical protein
MQVDAKLVEANSDDVDSPATEKTRHSADLLGLLIAESRQGRNWRPGALAPSSGRSDLDYGPLPVDLGEDVDLSWIENHIAGVYRKSPGHQKRQGQILTEAAERR